MAIHMQDLLEDGSWWNETLVEGREWVLCGGERLARDVFLLAQQGLKALTCGEEICRPFKENVLTFTTHT